MAGRASWTYDETRLAFALYFLIGASKADKRNKDVQQLAQAIGRTPDAVAMKLSNIAAHDKNRVALGRVGLRNGAKLERTIWHDFETGGDAFMDGAVDALERTMRTCNIEYDSLASAERGLEELPAGRERTTLVRQRVNQRYFRHTLLELYRGRCCLTHLAVPELLVASHIKPWAACDPTTERLAASNGLLLNALHDRAFDQGFMTIDRNLRVRIASCVRRDEASERDLWRYDGVQIDAPAIHRPAPEFIEYHNDVVFRG